MLESLVISKTRLKVLLNFFIYPSTRLSLIELTKGFNAYISIRLELNRLKKSNLLISHDQEGAIQYKPNTKNVLFENFREIALKYVGYCIAH